MVLWVLAAADNSKVILAPPPPPPPLWLDPKEWIELRSSPPEVRSSALADTFNIKE